MPWIGAADALTSDVNRCVAAWVRPALTGARSYRLPTGLRSPHSPIGRGSGLKIRQVSVRVRLGAPWDSKFLGGGVLAGNTAKCCPAELNARAVLDVVEPRDGETKWSVLLQVALCCLWQRRRVAQ